MSIHSEQDTFPTKTCALIMIGYLSLTIKCFFGASKVANRNDCKMAFLYIY